VGDGGRKLALYAFLCDGPIDFDVSWDSGEVRQQDGTELTAKGGIERERLQMDSSD